MDIVPLPGNGELFANMWGDGISPESFKYLTRFMDDADGDKLEKIVKSIEPLQICEQLEKDGKEDYGELVQAVRERYIAGAGFAIALSDPFPSSSSRRGPRVALSPA